MAEPASNATMSAQTEGETPALENTSQSQNVEDQQTEVEEVEQIEDAPFHVTVVLPHGEKPFDLAVSPIEQIHEIRQSIIEQQDAIQYSCFHLEHNGEPINDFAQVSDISGLAEGSELHLVEDPYSEKEARIHLVRVRELIGAAGDRTDTVHGIHAGLSLHDDLVAEAVKQASSFVLSEAKAKNEEERSEVEIEEYDFEAPTSVFKLVPRRSEVAPRTVKAIGLSAWNPPPAHLRQRGHLLYLTASTLDGDFHITAHVGGFFVNKCTNQNFDPFPKSSAGKQSAHSLLSLLEEISPKFGPAVKELQAFQRRKHPLSTFPIGNTFPAAPWIVPPTSSPLSAHLPDPTRSQETYLLAGVDNTDSLRDWNEEFQSAKELPKDTIQDRVFRERLLCKLYADYKEAATRGAVLVARGEVAPLNPTEARDAQIFVYNNVFFSFGADGVGTFTSEGGNEAARVATGKDVFGVKLVNQLDIDGLYTPGTVVVDYLGKRIVGQSIVPGIFKQPEPGENQIHYGAVDGKEVVAADERFVPVFKKLAEQLHIKKHSVWDKEGKEFELEASVEMKGLLGTDGRKYVLDLYRITPLDKLWMNEDPEKEEEKYPHRMTVLRPELMMSLAKAKAREYADTELKRLVKSKDEAKGEEKKEDGETAKGEEKAEGEEKTEETEEKKVEEKTAEKQVEEAQPERIDLSGFRFSLNPDAFSDQKPQTEAQKEELARDEDEVLAACQYLRDVVMPTLLYELRRNEISFPVDGTSLTNMLHRRGINIRYLGHLALLSDVNGEEYRLRYFHDLCTREMVARSFKHVAAKYLKELPLPLTSACFAHLLNCLLGYGLNPNPVAEIDETFKQLYKSADLAFADVTPESLRAEIESEVYRRFRFSLVDEWWESVGNIQTLREISLKLGLQLQAKEYAFGGVIAKQTDTAAEADAEKDADAEKSADDKAATGTKSKNKKKKKKAARDGSPASINSARSVPHTFSPDDIVNVVPISKDAAPQSAIATEALEAGRISILQNQRKLGEELLLESLSLHEQIYGPLHPDVGRAYSALANLYQGLGLLDVAIENAQKACVVTERTIGIDSGETMLAYLSLSLLLHQDGKHHEAVVYNKHALELWKILYGRDHPDTVTTLNNTAVILQAAHAYHESRRWFEECLRASEAVFGKDSTYSAAVLFQLGQALALDKESKEAVNKMRECRNIFSRHLGEQDKNTIDAGYWLAQLTSNAVNLAKQAKRTNNGRFRFTTMGMSGGADATNIAGSRAPAPAIDERDLDDLVKFIEGTPKKGGAKPGKKRGPQNPRRRGGGAAGAA
ncbi:Clustered mitochondria domain containing protein [Naviculisporaceae sp. PSN 640]